MNNTEDNKRLLDKLSILEPELTPLTGEDIKNISEMPLSLRRAMQPRTPITGVNYIQAINKLLSELKNIYGLGYTYTTIANTYLPNMIENILQSEYYAMAQDRIFDQMRFTDFIYYAISDRIFCNKKVELQCKHGIVYMEKQKGIIQISNSVNVNQLTLVNRAPIEFTPTEIILHLSNKREVTLGYSKIIPQIYNERTLKL